MIRFKHTSCLSRHTTARCRTPALTKWSLEMWSRAECFHSWSTCLFSILGSPRSSLSTAITARTSSVTWSQLLATAALSAAIPRSVITPRSQTLWSVKAASSAKMWWSRIASCGTTSLFKTTVRSQTAWLPTHVRSAKVLNFKKVAFWIKMLLSKRMYRSKHQPSLVASVWAQMLRESFRSFNKHLSRRMIISALDACASCP